MEPEKTQCFNLSIPLFSTYFVTEIRCWNFNLHHPYPPPTHTHTHAFSSLGNVVDLMYSMGASKLKEPLKSLL